MIVKTASEAEAMTAAASYRRHDPDKILLLHRTLDRVLAVGCWAPFQDVAVLDVCAVEEFSVSALQFGCYKNIERPGVEDAMASVGRALDPGSFAFFSYLLR